MNKISQKQADFIVAMISIGWGSSYLFMKMGLESLGIFNLIFLRMGIAFLITAPFFYRKLLNVDKKTLLSGALLGFILFLVLLFLMLGVKHTSASSAGFLGGTTVVFVPLLQTILHRKLPMFTTLAGVILAMIGIGMLTLHSDISLNTMSLCCVVGALIYAGQIIITSHLSKQSDPLILGILQLGFASLFALILLFFMQPIQLPGSGMEWLAVLALSLICSAFGFLMQPIALKYTTAERMGVLFALEPVFGAIFGFIFLNEILDFQGYIGALLVFAGVFISGCQSLRMKKQLANNT